MLKEINFKQEFEKILKGSKVNGSDHLDHYHELMGILDAQWGFPIYTRECPVIRANFMIASAFMNGATINTEQILGLNRDNEADFPIGFEYVTLSEMYDKDEFKGGVNQAFHLACWLVMATGGVLPVIPVFLMILATGNTPNFCKEMYRYFLIASMIYTGDEWLEKFVSYFEKEVTDEFGDEALRDLEAGALRIIKTDPSAQKAKERLNRALARVNAKKEAEADATSAPVPPEPVVEDNSEAEALAEAKRVLAEAQALHETAAAERAAAEEIAREERERLMRETASYTTTVTTYSRGGSAPKDNNVTAGDVVLAGLAIAGIAAVGYGVYNYLTGGDSDIELCETFDGRLF